MYFDDPGSSTWKQFPFEYTPAAPPVSSYTVVGALALTQYADAIRAMSLSNALAGPVSGMALTASGSLGATSAWTVSLTASFNPMIGVEYPSIGVGVSNGTTINSSVMYGMSMLINELGINSSPASQNLYLEAGEWTVGSSRVSSISQLNALPLGFTFGNGRVHLRLLNDGTLLHYQISADGMQWGNYYAAATPTPTGGFTDYGFWISCGGSANALTMAQAIVYSNNVSTPTTYTISAFTYTTPNTVYTIGSHSIQVGDFVSVHGGTGSALTNFNTGTIAQNGYNTGAGSSPQGVGALVLSVTSTTVTVYNAAASGTYTPNTGTMYLLSR
jgi:hypothetical protein